MLKIGAHVSAGQPLREVELRGADVLQFFLSNPQSWKKPKQRDDTEQLRSSVLPIYVHAPYLVNVVSDNHRIRIPSRRILQETCDAAAAIGAAGVVVHGGHVLSQAEAKNLGKSPNPELVRQALPRWRKAIKALDTDLLVLIENTAGGEMAAARRLEQIGWLWEEIADLNVGFVLDTCHAWAGGEEPEGLVERVMAKTGRIDLVHCNDSRDQFGSGADRHANLGKGQIPLPLLGQIVRDAAAPVIVETPGDVVGQKADIDWLRSHLAETGLCS